MIADKIKNILHKGFPALTYKIAPPEVKGHGHYSTNIAFALSKEKKLAPIKAAELIKHYLIETAPKGFFERIEIAPPGFINFWLTPHAIQSEFESISEAGGEWGKESAVQKSNKSKKVIVEYSSPNIAKPMHVGHFRSTIIGDAIANIHEFLGFKTIRWNYVGDWGVQFGKLTAAYKLWGNKEELVKDPIKTLLALYVRFSAEAKANPELETKGQAEFRKLEKGDKENIRLWKWFSAESLKDFRRIYKMIGVKFDIESGESFYEKSLVSFNKFLLEKGIAKMSEGAAIIPLDKVGLPPAMVQKSDGASLYFTRELLNLQYRGKKYKPAKILYVVGSEQELHFRQLFAVAKLGLVPGIKSSHEELAHIGHGLVLGEDGKKLSTRAGKTVFIEDVIGEAVEKTRAIVEEKNRDLDEKEKNKIAKVVAIGALKYNDLSQNRLSNITFDWEKMLSFEGDSGPYLQYTYARLRSILRKEKAKSFDKKNLESELEIEIILKLDRFPEVLKKVAAEYYPNDLAAYLYDIAKSINHFYQVLPILKAEEEVKKARLALIDSASKVLKTGLNLLGVETIEEM